VVKKEPVSIKRQTIYAIIPILDLYAAYRVQRLRWYILIQIGYGILYSLVQYALIPESLTNPEYGSFSDPAYNVIFVLGIVVSIPLSIYLIRRWSHKWNEKLKLG